MISNSLEGVKLQVMMRIAVLRNDGVPQERYILVINIFGLSDRKVGSVF